ncbi:MAG: NADPH-dependent glutamate synthase [Syntrophobacteraceae bacterium]|nr:NADPH-dependent glutamate synthase [Syntrophobacteraceae bacterium]
MATLTQKERMKIPRQDMPVQTPEDRVRNFSEVALGYTLEMAKMEAERCLQCKDPHCMEGCPVEVRIPEFIQAVRDGDMAEAVKIMKSKNNLPAICGRVCPQEVQCEARCILGKKGEPVAIGRIERFVGDYELANKTLEMTKEAPTGKKVAICGSGPAGITCAVDLARLGHEVTIFESLHTPGGVLVYGIPEFRLPKESVIKAEIETAAKALSIRILTDYIIGRTLTIDELQAEYDAIFLGTGAGLPMFMRIPGINFNGVMSANEFLTRCNLMKGYRFPEFDTPVKVGKKVAVIGAGNVAMDAARSSKRLQSLTAGANGQSGAEVHIVYRRSSAEVPARLEEVHHAKEEGVIFDFLTNPVEILSDEKNAVRAMRCIRMELGEPDQSGRRSPVPIKGSEFDMEVDQVIFALGTSPNPLVFTNAAGLERSKWGTVVANTDNGRTTLKGIWAGGDVVTGAATVISAMGAGKRAAADIDRFLKGEFDWQS